MKSLNYQLVDAVAELATHRDNLNRIQAYLKSAQLEYDAAVSRYCMAKQKFDELVQQIHELTKPNEQ